MTQSSEANAGCLGAFLGALVGIFFGMVLGCFVERSGWHAVLVKKVYALYNPQNGQWMWKQAAGTNPTLPPEREQPVPVDQGPEHSQQGRP